MNHELKKKAIHYIEIGSVLHSTETSQLNLRYNSFAAISTIRAREIQRGITGSITPSTSRRRAVQRATRRRFALGSRACAVVSRDDGNARFDNN